MSQDSRVVGTEILIANDRDVESRGILALSAKDSWLPEPVDDVQYHLQHEGERIVVSPPFVVNTVVIDPQGRYYWWPDTNSSVTWGVDPGVGIKTTADHVSCEWTLASIFTTSLQITNGSAATALSTLYTILSAQTYNDQMPSFAETTDVTMVSFEIMLFPQSFRGFTVVAVITVTHCILVLLIVITFITSTSLTILGDHWQSISQIARFLPRNSCKTDKDVREYLKAEHREREVVSIQPLSGSEEGIGLVTRSIHRQAGHGPHGA